MLPAELTLVTTPTFGHMAPYWPAQPTLRRCAAGDLDYSSLSSDLVVGAACDIADVNVPISIAHGFVGDLVVKLMSPAGTQVTLFDRQCNGNNDIGGTFDDDGAATVCATPVVAGMPSGPGMLTDFWMEDAAGTWTLEVLDENANDQGTLVSWGLDLMCATGTTSPSWALPRS